MGFGAYQICVRRSNPSGVVVGPAMGIQVLPKLSLGVKVTPKWEEANRTSKSPPVLSKGTVVCVVKNVALR